MELGLAQKSSSAKCGFILSWNIAILLTQWLAPLSIYWNSGYCFSRALIGYSTSGYPVLFTVLPPVPPSERRQTHKKTKKFHKKSNKLFPKYTKKVTKFGLELFTGKALSIWLEFIDETGEKVFCLQMQMNSFVTLFSWQGSNISLKLDLIVFLQNGFKYKKNSQLVLKKFSRKS